MKRNLVSYERFEQMKKNSLSTVVNELIEAQEHLARTLGTNSLVLESFDDGQVIYQKENGTFVKANYSVEDDAVTFDNLEELVIDEESEKNKRREIIGQMLEAILDDKESSAHSAFEKYMELAAAKKRRDGTLLPPEEIDETYVRRYVNNTNPNRKKTVQVRHGNKDPERVRRAKKGWAHRRHSNPKRHANLSKERAARSTGKAKATANHLHSLSGGKQYKKRHINEWLTLTNNVFEYADIVENGYILQESVVRTDALGEVTGVKIPSSKVRNEGKILKMHYDKMIKQDSPKVMRESGLRLATDPRFAAAVSELKRHNNLSDDAALEETLQKIVKTFPAVLYLTHEELAKSIGHALENAGVTNFADAHCGFMAEGILRTAHNLYEDRVNKLFAQAKVEVKENEDSFKAYQTVAANFFPTLDEAIQTEQKVFEDLYNAVLDVRKAALESQNEEVRTEANDIVNELERVLKGEVRGGIDFAVEVADWLQGIAEANLPGASEKWDLPKTPHHTITGDHPILSKLAKTDGNPASYPGDWKSGEYQPMIGQDSNSWDHGAEASNRSWSNKGGKDVWPSLENPAVPKPFGDYTMKGEKGADKDGDNDWSRFQSGDTWPNLVNPYVPKALIPKQKVDTSKGASVE